MVPISFLIKFKSTSYATQLINRLALLNSYWLHDIPTIGNSKPGKNESSDNDTVSVKPLAHLIANDFIW